jgi:phosphoglycolate phosphatase
MGQPFTKPTAMRTLLFDIDGTLIDAAGAGRQALNQALRDAFGVEPTHPIVFGGRTDRSLLSEMLRIHGQEVSDDTFAKLRGTFASCMPRSLCMAEGSVLPGVPQLLSHLKTVSNGRLWCMTGNLAETAHSKLSHFGLDRFFEQIVGGDHDEDRCDLARRARQTIQQHHGEAAASNVVVIGDTISDIQCARAIGAKVIACCTGFHPREVLAAAQPCAIVDDLTNLPQVMQLLLE